MSGKSKQLIPSEFLKVLAIWSLVPAYLIGGGVLGYGVDAWLGSFPYGTSVGLLIALVLAVRDMLRLKEEW